MSFLYGGCASVDAHPNNHSFDGTIAHPCLVTDVLEVRIGRMSISGH